MTRKLRDYFHKTPHKYTKLKVLLADSLWLYAVSPQHAKIMTLLQKYLLSVQHWNGFIAFNQRGMAPTQMMTSG